MAREPRNLKVTQEQYFTAALEHLADHGAEGLTIGALCRALGVTSGSFYHYFGNWGGFLDALLEHWEDVQTGRIVARAASQATADKRLAVLQSEAAELPHEAEAAIRAWGQGEEKVRLAQQRVDTRRREELEAIIIDVGVAPDDAARLATMGMAVLVGIQQLQRPVDVPMLFTLLEELANTVRRYAAA
jgi:AcrR family transcriptional regulator